MTVLETIQRSAEFLAKKGVDSPRLQVELLLAHLLNLPRMKLYLNFERKLAPDELEQLRALVVRRGQREPLQQIIGSTCFCGFDVKVTRDVLVPRPETELLAEAAWQFLNALPKNTDRKRAALDFGTGSGCIAIAMAAKCPDAQMIGLDVSADALAVARENAQRHGLDSRIQWLQGDGFGALSADSRFDVIVSNPPYIPTGEIATLQPEVRDFDPRLALDGGADGLDFYRWLAREAAAFLHPDGRILLEFGDGQADALREIFTREKWIVEAVKDDYNRRPRILVARRTP